MVRYSNDSGNKKLAALLDKRPRWLRPVDDKDFSQRCQQLSQSSTKIKRSLELATTQPFPKSSSSLSPTEAKVTKKKKDTHVSSQSLLPAAEEPVSSSSTTGSEILSDHILSKYPKEHIRMIEEVIMRHEPPSSLSSNRVSASASVKQPSWLRDGDAATPYVTFPFPLPGDFLRLDHHRVEQQSCSSNAEKHKTRQCLCVARDELLDAYWVTPAGLSPSASQIIVAGYSSSPWTDLKRTDAFGNTMLHLLAARGLVDGLMFYLHDRIVSQILNRQNSAGQTFLHVLDLMSCPLTALHQLLDLLATKQYAHSKKFDFAAQDHYGRTFFHALPSAGVPVLFTQSVLERYRPTILNHRDAFGTKPMDTSGRLSTPTLRKHPGNNDNHRDNDENHDNDDDSDDISDNDDNGKDAHIVRDSRRLQFVREALGRPDMEDEDGGNGLHSLALASLSETSLLEKNKAQPQSSSRQKRKRDISEEPLDSSTDRLGLRLSLAKQLLDSGVNPNHYDLIGNTPLMAFVAQLPEDDDYKTGPEIIHLLLKGGANIHARNRSGETALHVAVRCGRKLAVRELLAHNANVHARDAAGRGVLSLADAKIESCGEEDVREYAHYEACRAYLSGIKGNACQEPSILQEWGHDE